MNDLRNRAATIMANIFETMFFIFIEPQEDVGPNEGEDRKLSETGPGNPSAQYLRSSIQVEGEVSGHIKLYLPYDLARSMAQNFLGLDEEVPQSQALDMVGELLNMISGNLLSSGSKKIVYKLSMPSNEAVDSQELEKEFRQQGMNLDFDVEGQKIRLQIQLH